MSRDELLERDLRRAIGEKLNNWVKDSVALYGMVDLCEDVAMAAVSSTLLDRLVTLLAMTDCDANELGALVAEQLRRKRRRIAETRAQEQKQ